MVFACVAPPHAASDAPAAADAASDASVDAGPIDPAAPNLRLRATEIAASLSFEAMDFAPGTCAVAEGCAVPGRRYLLRFATVAENTGTQDLFVGVPGDFGGEGAWEWSSCHGHYHFKTFATYELVDGSGAVVVTAQGPKVSRKQAFCLEDTERIADFAKAKDLRYCTPDDPPGSPCRYNCNLQGISGGWADTYAKDLPCQWIDVCGVPPGDYALRIRLNTEHRLPESRFDDNELSVPVTFGALPPTPGLCQ